jgi:hypothetical protein
MAKFKTGQRVWFTKSMRICDVVQVLPKRRKKDEQEYIIETIDLHKQLYAWESGLIDLNEYTPDSDDEWRETLGH